MGRYRKVDPRIWNDEKFRTLSHSGQFVFLFLITHPHLTSLGAMRETVPGLAAELHMPNETFTAAFADLVDKHMVEYSEAASFIALPNFLKYNRPENPNVFKAWVAALDLLPECDLKQTLLRRIQALSKTLSKGFQEALPQPFKQP